MDYIANPRYNSILIDVCHVVLGNGHCMNGFSSPAVDLYGSVIGLSIFIDNLLRMLKVSSHVVNSVVNS